MKNILYLISLLLLASCQRAILDEETDDHSGTQGMSRTLTVHTRSVAGTEASTPLHLYAFDAAGALTASQVVDAASAEVELSLPDGASYRIMALVADADVYDIPQQPSLSSVITHKATGFTSASPLQMGYADVTLAGRDASLHIQMNYPQCRLNVSLANMPEACSSATVTVASPAKGITLAGQLQETQNASIPCTKVDGLWTTGDVYLLPTTGQQTTFTIGFSDGTTEYMSSATYQGLLHAGIPYIVSGNYANGQLTISGTITAPEWAAPVNLSFSFGNDTQTTIDGGGQEPTPDDSTEPLTVTEIPQPISVWNGHIVAAVLDGEGNAVSDVSAMTEATLLLLSLTDWSDVVSAKNADNPTMAEGIANGYTELGIADWTIPTNEQAAMLISAYSYDLAAAVAEANGDQILLTSGSNNSNVRYLCNNAQSTFRFSASGILAAGASTTYNLRLVRTFRVKTIQ